MDSPLSIHIENVCATMPLAPAQRTRCLIFLSYVLCFLGSSFSSLRKVPPGCLLMHCHLYGFRMDSAHLTLLLRQVYRLEQLGLPPARLSKPRGSPVVSPHASPWYHCPLFAHLLLCLSCSICMIIACNSALILTGLMALDQAPLEARFPRGTCVLVCLLVVSLLDY